MSRNTNSNAASSRSIFENLEGRALFSYVAAVDFNADGMASGDDYAALASQGGTPEQFAALDSAMAMDYNADGKVTGDDLAVLISVGGSNEDVSKLDKFLAEPELVESTETNTEPQVITVESTMDYNGDGTVSGDDLAALDSLGGSDEQHAALENALKTCDFNKDGKITGDDYTYLDTHGGFAAQYKRLDTFFGEIPTYAAKASETSVVNEVDFNGDGLITGDDFAVLAAKNGSKQQFAKLEKVLSVDFNEDGKITGDDYSVLVSNGGTISQFQKLNEVMAL